MKRHQEELDTPRSRRVFMGALAGLGASAALYTALPRTAWGQDAAKPPAGRPRRHDTEQRRAG